MRLTRTFRVGGLTCHTLDAGTLRLDGGAMFGIVPKPLWARKIECDERNRIPLAMRCLLIEHPDGLVLLDTGLGNKESEKFLEIYGVENAGSERPGKSRTATRLDDAIVEAGHQPSEIRIVVNTHLHFDHAGGNTSLHPGNARPVPHFENARYVVQQGELEFAGHTNERTAGSYLAHNFQPITERGLWDTVRGDREIVPGVTVVPTPGHTPWHQSVIVRDRGETACFVADLVPTARHLNPAWIMGYDLEPLVTLEHKKDLLNRAADEGWLMIFEHDPDSGVGRVVKDGKSFGFKELDIQADAG